LTHQRGYIRVGNSRKYRGTIAASADSQRCALADRFDSQCQGIAAIGFERRSGIMTGFN